MKVCAAHHAYIKIIYSWGEVIEETSNSNCRVRFEIIHTRKISLGQKLPIYTEKLINETQNNTSVFMDLDVLDLAFKKKKKEYKSLIA